MDKNKLNDLAGRLQRGGKGAGVGLGFLAAAGGIVYGLYQSLYTGKSRNSAPVVVWMEQSRSVRMILQ